MLRCKLYVNEVKQYPIYGRERGEQIRLVAHYDGDEGGINSEWSEATPNAEFTLDITNPNALGQLEVGKYYYVDITPIEA